MGVLPIRRLALPVLFVICAAVVVGYQVVRSTDAESAGQPFVPSPQFFLDFSPSFRTTIADAYWVQTVQYYGGHVKGDQQYQKLAPMLDIITILSPHFERPYLFGAYALLEAGLGGDSYALLQRGFRENPQAWKLAVNAGILMYYYGPEDERATIAARWFEKAAKLPGAPDYVPRIAARLLAEGGRLDKAVALDAQVYATGDQYSRETALRALDEILPRDAVARRAALEKVRELMAPETFDALLQALGAA